MCTTQNLFNCMNTIVSQYKLCYPSAIPSLDKINLCLKSMSLNITFECSLSYFNKILSIANYSMKYRTLQSII